MPPETSKKILIVDDESSLRTLLKAVLDSEPGYELQEASNGDEALELITQSKPDLIILDVMMPGQSGFEVCEKIKRNNQLKDIIVLILTAKGQKTDQEWASSVGADCFLSKPFSPLELINLIENLLSNKASL
jgi:CheY-like chemotaxis protein